MWKLTFSWDDNKSNYFQNISVDLLLKQIESDNAILISNMDAYENDFPNPKNVTTAIPAAFTLQQSI